MLRSSNPILSKKDAFTPAAPQYDQNPYGQSAGYGQYPAPGSPQAPVQSLEGRMTFDDVVTKTALTMGVLIITAALARARVRSGNARFPSPDGKCAHSAVRDPRGPSQDRKRETGSRWRPINSGLTAFSKLGRKGPRPAFT